MSTSIRKHASIAEFTRTCTELIYLPRSSQILGRLEKNLSEIFKLDQVQPNKIIQKHPNLYRINTFK